MTERVVDISEEAARLSVRNNQLIIAREKEETAIPLAEIVALVISHPAVVYTHAVIAKMCALGGVCVICDEKRLPVGMSMSLQSNTTQAERFVAQAKAGLPLKKRLWQSIVRRKVEAQGEVLLKWRGDDMGLLSMAKMVRSGDAGNIESRASRRYWKELLGKEFTRDPMTQAGCNSLLNYGYAILRAITARAICASGLHPSLGLYHHNRYDAFVLADDLMEPLRPIVDQTVVKILHERGNDAQLDKETKGRLIADILGYRPVVNKEECSIFESLARMSSSLAQTFTGKRVTLDLPKLSAG